MPVGVGSANPTGGEAAAQGAYYELITARGSGSPVNYSSVISNFKGGRPAGAPAGKVLMYDLPGGNYTPDTAPDPITGTTDTSMNPANFFGAANVMPADLFNWVREVPIGGDVPYTAGASGNYPPRIWDQRYVQYLMAHYASRLAACGMDGVQPDVCGRLVCDNMHQGANNSPWLPVAQATSLNGFGGAWPPFYVSQMATMVAAIQQAIGGSIMPCMPNGLGDGYKYFASDGGPTSLVSAGTVGAMCENFLRGDSDAVNSWPTETPSGYNPCWQQSVDMLLDAGVKGKVILCMNKLWIAATTLQEMQWLRFSLGSFLLGTDGSHYWQHRGDNRPNGTIQVSSGSNSVTGSGTAFLTDIGQVGGVESLRGTDGSFWPISTVGSNTSMTLVSNISAGGAIGTAKSNWATDNPLHGPRRQKTSHYFTDVPNYAGGTSSGPNPDPANWFDRILNTDLTLKLGIPTDNYVQPISAQRQTGGGSAYYFRRFAAGLVVVNPTSTNVTGLDATASPLSVSGSGTWNDIGAELNGNGRTSGSTLQTITSLFVPAHSALVLVHT